MAVSLNDKSDYARSLITSPVSGSNKSIESTHSALSLLVHPEGGYFAETDRDVLKIPNPFRGTKIYANATVKESQSTDTDESESRNASTTIFYFLDPKSPIGVFHRNKGRTVHTLHSGRGIYVLIHADEAEENHDAKVRVETFVVGHDIARGEKLQWIVEGEKFKSSFLLPDKDSDVSEGGLLISETVVPGFEFMDHDFLTLQEMKALLKPEDVEELSWLLRKEEQKKIPSQG